MFSYSSCFSHRPNRSANPERNTDGFHRRRSGPTHNPANDLGGEPGRIHLAWWNCRAERRPSGHALHPLEL